MTMINQIEPQEWATFLAGFTTRNRGRGARFELFGPKGGLKEEEREATFESITVDGHVVTVVRSYVSGGTGRSMTDELKNVRGISVQYDTDHSEDMLEFTDDRNAMTTLHFASRVDGNS